MYNTNEEYPMNNTSNTIDTKELVLCPTDSCDGTGHVSGNFATHRRQATLYFYDCNYVTSQLLKNLLLSPKTNKIKREK